MLNALRPQRINVQLMYNNKNEKVSARDIVSRDISNFFSSSVR